MMAFTLLPRISSIVWTALLVPYPLYRRVCACITESLGFVLLCPTLSLDICSAPLLVPRSCWEMSWGLSSAVARPLVALGGVGLPRPPHRGGRVGAVSSAAAGPRGLRSVLLGCLSTLARVGG